MADEKNVPTVVENLQVLATPEGFQKYLLGTKKNGQPRAVYDVVKDYTKPKKKKKKKKSKDYDKLSSYDIYMKYLCTFHEEHFSFTFYSSALVFL